MSDNKDFRKKFLLPTVYCAVVAMAIWSGNSMVSSIASNAVGGYAVSGIETASGEEAEALPKVSEAELADAPELPALPVAAVTQDATELPPLRISPDKPEVIQLDRDAVNVLVGSDETLRAVPDTNRTIVLIPKKPGATYFKATDAEGKVIMQRHVIVGAPDKGSKYLRIRRACANDDKACKQFSVYYCPDVCHEVNVVQGDASTSQENQAPNVAPSVSEPDSSSEYVEPAEPSPAPQ